MNDLSLGLLGALLLLCQLARIEGLEGDPNTVNDLPEFDYLDHSVDPCDNFYQFTCGNFKNVHPIPDDELYLDEFLLLSDELTQVANDILSTPRQAEDPIALRKAKTAYHACMDTEMADSVKNPELRIIEEFGGMPLINPNPDEVLSWDQIGDMVANYGVNLIFDMSWVQMDSSSNYLYLSKDSLTNPNTIIPTVNSNNYDDFIENSIKEFAQKGFVGGNTGRNKKMGLRQLPFDIFLDNITNKLLAAKNPFRQPDQIAKDLNDVADFSRTLYAGGIPDETIEEPPQALTVGQLQEWSDKNLGQGKINWRSYLGRIVKVAGITLSDDLFILLDVSTFVPIVNLVLTTDPQIVKNFALLRLFLFLAPDSDGVTRQAFEDYYEEVNPKNIFPRWQYCTRKIMDASSTAGLSFALTYAFQRYHFNINKIEEAKLIIGDLEEAFIAMLNETTWMDVESREAALRKVERMQVQLAYPQFVTDKEQLDRFYENVRICDWDHYGNSHRIRAFRQAYAYTRLDQDISAVTFWDKSPLDVNAYYNRPNNKMIIPVSMLNGVFFKNQNRLIDYSRLGSIVGHEITHGFDNSGRTYDEDGLYQDWWSDETNTQFSERAGCFVDQYDRYYVEEIDKYVNGSNTFNENLADNGGLREAFRAYKKWTRDNLVVNLSNSYSREQLFFIGYGTMWCIQETQEYLTKLSSAYAPNRFRVNGPLANMEEFSDAFKCPVGSKMNPEKKCKLW